MQLEVQSLKQFHKAFRCDRADLPKSLSTKTAMLRAKLISEEANELIAALANGDIVEQFDAIIDLLYVTIGTAVANGTADFLTEGFAQVHANNMSKLIDGKVVKDASGKVLKPDGYKPVDLSWIKKVGQLC